MATNRSDILARFQAFKAGDVSAMRRSPGLLDQDPDLDLVNLRSRSDQDQPVKKIKAVPGLDESNPDGLNHMIKGQYADLLKEDPLYLKARSLGVHPATLTNATKRMDSEWVRKQVLFVLGNDKLRYPGSYLSKILANNPY